MQTASNTSGQITRLSTNNIPVITARVKHTGLKKDKCRGANSPRGKISFPVSGPAISGPVNVRSYSAQHCSNDPCAYMGHGSHQLLQDHGPRHGAW